MAYVELRCRSAFSFLRAASTPEALAQAAAALEMPALALTDYAGVYGAPRLRAAARKLGVEALVGAEVPLRGGARLPLLVENRAGYQNLCRLLTRLHLAAPKGEGLGDWSDLEEFHAGLVCLTGGDDGPLAAALRAAGRRNPAAGLAAAGRELDRLTAIFGRDSVFVETHRHLRRAQEHRARAYLDLAAARRLPLLATNAVAYATPAERVLADVFTCLRHKTHLDAAGRRLESNAERSLKSPAAMARLFADLPAAVAASGELAARLRFRLSDLGYEFPRAATPDGLSMGEHLRRLTLAGARRRYGHPSSPRGRRAARQIERELAIIVKLGLEGYFLIVHEIVDYCRHRGILAQGRGSAANSAVCYSLGITAVDPVGMDLLFERFLSEQRGEWPDIDLDLPSGERREEVLQHLYQLYGRRGAAMTANVITYRGRAAAREAAKVLDFSPPAAARLAQALDAAAPVPAPVPAEDEPLLSPEQAAAAARANAPREIGEQRAALRAAGFDAAHPRLVHFLRLVRAMQDLPRHLGQHSGGMVICRGSLDQVVPLENASMPGRTVVQWDKDDCADLGIIKVDLLGLGMMAVLQDALRLLPAPAPSALAETAAAPPAASPADALPAAAGEAAASRAASDAAHADGADPGQCQAGESDPAPSEADARAALASLDLARFPPDDPAVYRMLRAADTIGIFQVESRAQMATLPRLQPRVFYDLVVEVGLIRPGPIVGQMVNPYLRRRAGRAPVTYAHPSLEPILRRTLGVPLFQEQLLRMAMVAAGFSGGEAEELRRAFTHKRPQQGAGEIEARLRAGMAARGITGAPADEIVASITAFALYGFPESHAASFALLVYASAYLKVHHPAEFYVALLNNQPMGFYHPATLVRDAVQHGVAVLPISVFASAWDCAVASRQSRPALRLGLRYASGLREAAGRRLVAERERLPFASLEDLRRRAGLERAEARLLAELGAFGREGEHAGEESWPAASPKEALRPGASRRGTSPTAEALWSAASRREALWQIERAWRPPGPLYDAEATLAAEPPGHPLAEMDVLERLRADYRGSGLTLGPHPFALRRVELRAAGALTARQLRRLPSGRRARVAGLVIARQRPETAHGIVFLSLEDETGIANIIVPRAVFARDHLVCAAESELLIHGVIQNRDGVVHLRAERIESAALPASAPRSPAPSEKASDAAAKPLVPARDFR